MHLTVTAVSPVKPCCTDTPGNLPIASAESLFPGVAVGLSDSYRLQSLSRCCKLITFRSGSFCTRNEVRVSERSTRCNRRFWFLIKARCLCIEAQASGVMIANIESQLFSGDSWGRQRDRLKGGQIPEHSVFLGATDTAVSLAWLLRNLGEILKNAFSAKRRLAESFPQRNIFNKLKGDYCEKCYTKR